MKRASHKAVQVVGMIRKGKLIKLRVARVRASDVSMLPAHKLFKNRAKTRKPA